MSQSPLATGVIGSSKYSMRDVVERKRLNPAIVRRLDDMYRVIEV